VPVQAISPVSNAVILLTTKLEGPLKRELPIGGQLYTLTVSPTGLLLTLKGRRKGLELSWADLVSGEAALATALNASLAAPLPPRKTARPLATLHRQRSR
jgi:hypothetical protein